MIRPWHSFSILAALLLSIRTVESTEVILVIRTGALHEVELLPDAEKTPNLHWLLMHGASLPTVNAKAVKPAEGSAAATPEAILETLLPEPVIRHLRGQGITQVVLGGTADETRADEPQVTRKQQRHPLEEKALQRLYRSFGTPVDSRPAEEQTIKKLCELLGIDIRSEKDDQEKISTVEKIIPTSTMMTTRTHDALKKGARLVIVLDPIPEQATDRNTVAERDGLVGKLLVEANKRKSGSFLILSVPATMPEKAQLFAHGPRVRGGWVIPARIKLEDVYPTILWLLESKPVKTTEDKEIIHEMLRL